MDPSQSPTDEDSERYLGVKDLTDVFQELSDLSSKWKIIGVNLGIPIARLEIIGSTESYPENKLLETITSWLKGNYDEDKHGKPTWDKLAKAVGSTDKSVARRIRRGSQLVTSVEPTDGLRSSSVSSPPAMKSSSIGNIHQQTSSEPPNTRYDDDVVTSGWCCIPRKRKSRKDISNGSGVHCAEDVTAKQSTLITKATNPNSSVVLDASYHRMITGSEAEECLCKQPGNCYLTRFSERQKCYMLTAQFVSKRCSVMQHFKIMHDTKKIWLEFDERKIEFESFKSLLAYYKEKPITYEPHATLGKVCLKQT